MAPINPNNTQRFYVDYTVAGYQHTLQMRAGSTVEASDASATLAALFAAFDSAIYVATIDGFRSAAPGTNITVPEVWLGDAAYGVGAGVPANSAQYYDMVGRGATGHRVRVAIFGAILVTDGGDYRMSSSEDALVANALAVLTSDGDMFLDVDYEVPTWKPYINLGVNAYWRNKIR
jgi:hypothetical protein